MEPELAIISRNLTRLSQDWDQWMDFIWDEYLVKDRGIEEVFESLKQLNPQVKHAQLRAKLRQWEFHKTLSAENWRYIDHKIKARKSQNKKSTVVLSGRRLTHQKVKSQTDRHRTVTLYGKWRPPQRPKSPDESMPLYICTPRDTSPEPISPHAWPKALPWLQFTDSVLPELMSGLRLLPSSERGAAGAAITTSISKTTPLRKRRRPNDASLAWVSFEKLGRRSMEIVIGSNELLENLLLTKSVDRIASHLDRALPDNSPNGNIRRAIALSGGAQSEVQREVLKILLFLASNHLIMDRGRYYDHTYGVYIQDARAFVDAFCFSGLAELEALTRIVRISIRNPTMTAVLHLLYEAAVVTQSVDLVIKLLTADRRISPQRPTWRALSALEFAAYSGSLTFVQCMLQAEANAGRASRSQRRHSILPLAILGASDDVSVPIIRILLGSDTATIKDTARVALHVAVRRGKFHLIDLLHAAGMDFASLCGIDEIFYEPINVTSKRSGICQNVLNALESATCLDLAASFFSGNFDQQDGGSFAENEEISLRLVKHVVARAEPEFDHDGTLKSRAMVFAAMCGYTHVISYLYSSGGRVDTRIRNFLCPVYAAVNWAQVEACQQLLRLGGSAQAEYRWAPFAERFVQLSPLHVAISYNSIKLIGLLAKSGVDINLPCEVNDTPQEISRGFMCHYERPGEPFECLSPLGFSILLGFWEASLLLVNFGATFDNDDLFRAASAGQFQLVNRLLELQADPNGAVQNGQTALQASIHNGHELVAMRLLDAGARIEPRTLGIALQYGRHQVAIKLISTGCSLTDRELAWAFRIPDELIVQSLLQSRLPALHASERGPDGRSFLENAILSGEIAVIRFALSLDERAYDSGALCAAVLAAAGPSIEDIEDMDEIVRELIQRRELISFQSPNFDQVLENTAISISAYYGRVDLINWLHRKGGHGVNVAVLPERSAWEYPKPGRRLWPELCGISLSRAEHATIDVSILPFSSCRVFPSSLGQWCGWHLEDRWLTSPFFLAIKNRNELTMETLLDLGYKVDVCSLNASIFEDFSFGLMKRLIEACIDINAAEIVGMMHPYTPVLLAAIFKEADLVRILLDAGADPNSVPWEIRLDILRHLTQSGKCHVLDILLHHGININDVPPIRLEGDTPLQVAARKGDLGIMNSLLSHGAEPNARRAIRWGLTALEAAASQGRLDAAQLLLDSGVITDGFGRFSYVFAIYGARQAGHFSVASLLESYRKWINDDEEMMKELEQLGGRYLGIIHESEYTGEEMEEVLAIAHDLIQRGEVKVLRSSSIGTRQPDTHEDLGCVGHEGDQDGGLKEQDEMIAFGEPPSMDSCATTTDGRKHLHSRDEFQDVGEGHFNGGVDLRSRVLDEEVIMNDGDDLSRMELAEVEESNVDAESDTLATAFETIEERSSSELRNEAGQESERHQEILDDLLGEREAPFHPIEWAW